MQQRAQILPTIQAPKLSAAQADRTHNMATELIEYKNNRTTLVRITSIASHVSVRFVTLKVSEQGWHLRIVNLKLAKWLDDVLDSSYSGGVFLNNKHQCRVCKNA